MLKVHLSRACHSIPITLALVGIGVLPLTAKAEILSVLDASSIVQSTLTDNDVGLLSGLFGFQPGASLNYASSSTTSDWTGTLSGSYLGTALSVGYTGDLSGFPSGPVTWLDSGSYGTDTWTGSGSASFVDTSATTFQMTFSDSVDVDALTASANAVIPGTVLPDGTIMFGTLSQPEAGPGTAVIDGKDYDIYFSYRIVNGKKIYSDWIKVKKGTLPPPPPPEFMNQYVEKHPPIGPMLLNGTITAVPEPSTWPLLLVGLGAVFGLAARRRAA